MLTDLIPIISTSLGVLSILYALLERIYFRYPVLEIVPHKDEPTEEDRIRGYMWYHVKVRNKKPPRLFRREIARACKVRVSFLDKNGREIVRQITAHWTNQPEPRDAQGRFQASLIPMCQERDIGFLEEPIDILIKFEGERAFYAADPWVVYRFPQKSKEWEELKVEVEEGIIRLTFEAINLGRPIVKQLRFKIKGEGLDDVEIITN